MTHQNHQTNGASLEDCHTNFFALTELYGIKWRKLVWGETSGGGEGEEGGAPLADPVISSYARCLAGDILCVWRRVPAPQSNDIYEMSMPVPPPLSLRAAKELWIFWYGEEPDLNGLVAPELIASQGEQGSWESGLSYECRSLLFKALHNLIERCLLSRDFVRLGKWFVQPYDGDEEDVGKSPWHLSFSFAFFLHGESTVCASVDVRQHPPVRTLTAKRLARIHAPDNQPAAKVILAPFGLEGTLTGREWSDADAGTARLLDAWRQLYPLEQAAAAVEVVCGGTRMRYPVPYVLVTDMEAAPGPTPAPAARLANHALQALTTPAPHQPAEICYGDTSSDKSEDFLDPTRKTPCTCAKWRRRRPPRPPPFHRRAAARHKPAPRPAPHRPHRLAAGGGVAACSPGSCGGGSPAAAGSAPSSAGAPPPSPTHLAHHAHQPPESKALGALGAVPASLHTPAPTPEPPPGTPRTPAGACGARGAGAGAASPAARAPGADLARRPALPAAPPRLDPLEDEHELHMLYDYTTVYAWLEHPVKRFKSGESRFQEEMALGAGAGADLYAGHDHTRMAATAQRPLLDPKRDHPDHNDDSKEYKNLFTSDGLCPTFKDLDQIFDNSDDAASGDETGGLTAECKAGEEARCVRLGGCPRAEELSKMFPTPPSMEAHAQASPGFSLPDDATPLRHAPAPGSPPPDPAIEDWSYVFKPPTIYKYVGSSKYSPLTTLPSQLLPAVTLPPHAVYRPRCRDLERDHEPAKRDEPHADPPSAGVKRSASPAVESRERSRRACEAGAGAGASAGGGAAGRRAAASPAAGAAACPLLVNVLLADTVLNVFRDHNFDSCTLCVCNAGPKVVGNILGADAATYLAGSAGAGGAAGGDDEPAHCTCGFSAILNRRLAHRAGLFYEDELEITGLAEEPGGGGGGGGGAGLGEVAGAVAAACAAPAGGAASAVARAAAAAAAHPPHDDLRLNLLEYTDGSTAAARALRAAVGNVSSSSPNSSCTNGGNVHRWPFIGARAPRSSRDVVRLMRRLRPLLQDAIQKRCCGARMWDGVTGPLTWRQFHRLAGRGNEDLCEPQPVPPLLVGHDRDWISLSPYALRHWERLSLEPYSYSRDVAYVVLAAEGDALTEPLRAFFRELSTAYEACRLGRHQPVARLARDGIVRCGAGAGGAGGAGAGDERDEWAGALPPGRLGAQLRAFADTLRGSLVPQLAALSVDRALLEGERPAAEPMRPPAAPEHAPRAAGAAGGAGQRVGALGGRRRARARARPRARRARPRLQRVRRRAPPAGAPRRRQVAHRLRHRRPRQPLHASQGRKESGTVPTVLAGVGVGGAATAQGSGGDVGSGHRRAGRRAVPILLPVARPTLAAGRRHRRPRRAARHRRHQYPRSTQVETKAERSGAAARVDEADGLHARRDEPGRAAMAARRWTRRTDRTRRTQRLELAAVAQAPVARVGAAARHLRRLQRAVPGGALHPVRLPGVHGARLVPAPHGRPLHARRALLAGLHPVAPAHAARRLRHAHTRLPHLRHHTVEPDAVRAADGERRGQRHDVSERGHGRGHGRGQHDGPADRRHVQQHVGAGQPAARRRRPGRQPRRPPAPPRRLHARRRHRLGAGGRAAAAAAGAGLPGVDGAAGRHAGLVVGGLRAPARRVSRLPQERAAPAHGLRAGRRRLHLAHAAPRPQRAPARLADHHRRAQVRAGGLQRAVVAGAGQQHARPAVVPAAARAGAHAAVPHGRGARLAAAPRPPRDLHRSTV